ncbi:hypothetical protein E2C01_085347 [Portunus trituberculatus]|uniref:Uncharacterized protein n=1 Tax=Portunus trituberculatus TaxID=210409 RepID=A0A5B7J8M1_PORTR|nr:hypothetical protein [Portunus trituberculatus]
MNELTSPPQPQSCSYVIANTSVTERGGSRYLEGKLAVRHDQDTTHKATGKRQAMLIRDTRRDTRGSVRSENPGVMGDNHTLTHVFVTHFRAAAGPGELCLSCQHTVSGH